MMLKCLQDVERRCQERVLLGKDTAEEKDLFVQCMTEYIIYNILLKLINLKI